eukprot:scaffold641887_cov51-Attheya_sp.AAC.1
MVLAPAFYHPNSVVSSFVVAVVFYVIVARAFVHVLSVRNERMRQTTRKSLMPGLPQGPSF